VSYIVITNIEIQMPKKDCHTDTHTLTLTDTSLLLYRSMDINNNP